jgi:hypothetical protein
MAWSISQTRPCRLGHKTRFARDGDKTRLAPFHGRNDLRIVRTYLSATAAAEKGRDGPLGRPHLALPVSRPYLFNFQLYPTLLIFV